MFSGNNGGKLNTFTKVQKILVHLKMLERKLLINY